MADANALEMSRGVQDAESALARYAALYESGGLSALPFEDASALADQASSSVVVAANAFGVPPDAAADVTPDDLWTRMMAPYMSDEAVASLRADRERAAAAEDARREANMRAVLEGVSADVAERALADDALGDPSPLLRLKERFVFGR